MSRAAADAWHDLGRSHKAVGDLAAAIACYRRGLALQPDHPALLTSLGTALVGTGRRAEAAQAYRTALARHPGHRGARTSLDELTRPLPGGTTRLRQIRDEARRRHQAGDLAGALALHHEALRIEPALAGIWLSAGMLTHASGRQEDSLPLFEEAARLDPTLAPAIEAARRICVSAGLVDKAVHYSARAWALGPSDDLRIAMALTTEAIPQSTEAIAAGRLAFANGLEEARRAGLTVRDLDAAQGVGSFFLAYHGADDRTLQIEAARLLSTAAPELSWPAAHCRAPARRAGRIRIGFISAFLFDHSIGSTSRGLVEQLSREHFEVFVLRITPTRSDAVSAAICGAADHAVELNADYRIAREQIADLELDILFYQDIGMEPISCRLAFARLAPVQCVSFGHPNTTGIPTMDYFVSNDRYEPEDAQARYSERLFLLRDLPTLAYYHRPAAPRHPPLRTAFGLADDDHVYLCPQTLFKLHPDFDALLGRILRRDPRGVLTLIRGQYPEHTERILERWSRHLGDVRERILFLDRMAFPRYMELLSVADVCLDTLHFNGMNSSLEALSVGTPVVTLPGRLQRGRHTQAMYRQMGMTECIAADADDYVDRAVRIGSDAQYARSLRERILERCGVLFEDRRVVSEFERFFFHAVRHAGRDSGVPATNPP